MLDKLSSQDFTPKLGSCLEVVIDGGPSLSLELKEVEENEKALMPYADSDARTPFSLLFKGPMSPSIQSHGLCKIKDIKNADLEDVYITRTVPMSSEPAAWYEIIFN